MGATYSATTLSSLAQGRLLNDRGSHARAAGDGQGDRQDRQNPGAGAANVRRAMAGGRDMLPAAFVTRGPQGDELPAPVNLWSGQGNAPAQNAPGYTIEKTAGHPDLVKAQADIEQAGRLRAGRRPRSGRTRAPRSGSRRRSSWRATPRSAASPAPKRAAQTPTSAPGWRRRRRSRHRQPRSRPSSISQIFHSSGQWLSTTTIPVMRHLEGRWGNMPTV